MAGRAARRLDPHLAARVAATLRENQVGLFVPSPAFAAFMIDPSRRIILRSANRTGKTKHTCARLAKVMLSHPFGRYRAVGVNYVQTTRVLGKYLADFIPPSQLVDGCRYSQENGWSHQLIRLKNGATCQMMTDEQPSKAHAGDDLDGVLHDEPPKAEILSESQTRVMARKGWIWVAMTPINAPVAYIKAMVEDPDSAWTEYVVPLSVRNCPWYSKEQVETWIEEARASPGTYRQKVLGDWEGDSVGRTFSGWGANSTFNADLDDVLQGSKYTLGIGVDHGEGVGKQVSVFAVWDANNVYVIDETVNDHASTPDEDAQAIHRRLADWGWRLDEVERMVGDVNSAGKLSGGKQINELLSAALHRQAGFRQEAVRIETPSKGKNSVEFGERLINNALLRGTLHVHARCHNLIRSMRHYSPGDEEHKHAIDALRYLVTPVLESRTGTTPSYSRLRLR